MPFQTLLRVRIFLFPESLLKMCKDEGAGGILRYLCIHGVGRWANEKKIGTWEWIEKFRGAIS